MQKATTTPLGVSAWMAGFKTRFRARLPVEEPQLPSEPVVEGDVTPPLRVDSPSPPPGRGTAAASAPTARKAPPLVPKQPPYPPPQVELSDSDAEFVSTRAMEIGWEEDALSFGVAEPILMPDDERALVAEVKKEVSAKEESKVDLLKEEKVSVKKEVSAKEESKVDLPKEGEVSAKEVSAKEEEVSAKEVSMKAQSLWEATKSERVGWLESRLRHIHEEARQYLETAHQDEAEEEGLIRLDDAKKSSAWPEPTRTSETIIESKTCFNAFVIETRNIQILYKQGFEQ